MIIYTFILSIPLKKESALILPSNKLGLSANSLNTLSLPTRDSLRRN